MIWLGQAVGLFFRALRAGWQLVRCSYYLVRMHGPIVTIFGGGRVKRDSDYAKVVYQFAQLCASDGFSILTGGGPGAMEAANCGVRDALAAGQAAAVDTLGIGVYGVDKDFKNPCAAVLNVSDFATRKHLLMRYSCAFVAFPGGIGTMDEIFSLLNLAKHLRVPRMPIILVDTTYWHDLIEWYHDSGLEQGLIGPRHKEMLVAVDTPEQALAIIKARMGNRSDNNEP